MDAQVIGLVWDKYTPQVEGQITRDFIAMQSEGPRVQLLVVTPDDSADRLFAMLGVEKSLAPEIAKLWITYQTGPEKVLAPEHAQTVIERDLFIPKARNNIDTGHHTGYYMKPQGRITSPSMNVHHPSPTHMGGQTDPIVIWLWSSAKK
jgi:hypothetical protein